MSRILQWLFDENQKDLYEIVVAFFINLLFLAVISLMFWPLQKLISLIKLAKGFGLLWILSSVIAVILVGFQRLFRLNIYNRVNLYILSTMSVNLLLQCGWAAFAALILQNDTAPNPLWIELIMHGIGLVSCLIAFWVVSAFYHPGAFKLLSLLIPILSFIVFSIWPGVVEKIFQWMPNFI